MVIKLSPFSCTYIVIICGFPPCSDFIKLSFYSTPCCMVFLQVGCVCSPERRGKDAFSIIYPRCSAEISWQMAEDRPAGMYTRRRQWHKIIFIVVGFVFWLFFFFFPPSHLICQVTEEKRWSVMFLIFTSAVRSIFQINWENVTPCQCVILTVVP